MAEDRRRTLTSNIWMCVGCSVHAAPLCLCLEHLFAGYSRVCPNTTPLIQQSVYLSYWGAVCFFFPTLCFYSPSSPSQQLVSGWQRKPLKAIKAPGRSWARAVHLTWPAFWKKNDCPPLRICLTWKLQSKMISHDHNTHQRGGRVQTQGS